MATKETKPVVTDPWESPQETWLYVTIPDEDPLGQVFPNVSLNKHIFTANNTYHVPPAVAAYLNERIKVFNRSCVRLLQPTVDRKALQEVAVGTASPIAPTYIDATQVKTT